MVLLIGEVKWMLHFHTEHDIKDGGLWDTEVRVHVHTGPCIESFGAVRHCVNGSVGIAKCSRKDRFVRAVGNRLALTRAIKHLPEATRKAIWSAYWLKARRPKEDSLHFQARIAGTAPEQVSAT